MTIVGLGGPQKGGLQSYEFAPEYRRGHADMVRDFFVPCLRVSTHYMRAAGYFTSHSLALVAAGLPSFIAHDGLFRLIASPYLSLSDVDALKRGVHARNDVVERTLLDAFATSDESEIVRQRLGFLAWMVAADRLEIRIAIPTDNLGLYHEKYGIFLDGDGDGVAFTGSPNETRGGLESNFESIDVFESWSPEGFRVELKKAAFEAAWRNELAGLTTIPLPEAVRQSMLRLRPAGEPERDPFEFPVEEVSLPATKPVEPRRYQLDAAERWASAGFRGIFEMATGTGKTVASLICADNYIKGGPTVVVVAAPYKHLVDQWDIEMKAFGHSPVLCYESGHEWLKRLERATSDVRIGIRPTVVCIATHDALRGDRFQTWFNSLPEMQSLLIADEVHNLGSPRAIEALGRLDFEARLGLSATPRRWSDDETRAVFDYFGDVVFEFSLEEAIREGYLVPYTYHPHLVELNDEEMTEYVEVSRRLARLGPTDGDGRLDDLRGHLLRRRASVLNNAEGKLQALQDELSDDPQYTLIYTTPERLQATVRLVADDGRRMVHRFTFREKPKERQRLLMLFSKGEIGVLVAIRCLDEGVDIPKTETAHILASSSNSREFVQRRGRILRRAPGKERAAIHDYLAIPAREFADEGSWRFERQIVAREVRRFREFASTAINRFGAEADLLPLLKRYGLFDI